MFQCKIDSIFCKYEISVSTHGCSLFCATVAAWCWLWAGFSLQCYAFGCRRRGRAWLSVKFFGGVSPMEINTIDSVRPVISFSFWGVSPPHRVKAVTENSWIIWRKAGMCAGDTVNLQGDGWGRIGQRLLVICRDKGPTSACQLEARMGNRCISHSSFLVVSC